MKIIQIDVYQVTYKYLGGAYTMSGGRSIASHVGTIVKVSTDEGLNGFGEVCPLGSAYMDAINIKFSRVGGLSKAKQIHDLREILGIIMTIEDSWEGDITTATISHLAGSTRPEFFF